MQKMTGGIITQGLLELCHKDIEFLPLFKKCKCSGGICKPEIEDNMWKGYDAAYQVGGGYGLNKDEAYMICLTNEGCIYAVTDGQRNAAREAGIWLSELNVTAVVCAGMGGLTKEQEEENARYMYYYLSGEGWSKEAICGLLGNINKECV